MRFFDHLGHFGHGHSGVVVAILVGVFVAIAGAVFAIRSQKNPDA